MIDTKSQYIAACDEYELGFSDGFWDEVQRACKAQLD